MKKNVRRFWRAQNGVATVEFALVLPILLGMFLGMVELSEAHLRRKAMDHSAVLLADNVSKQKVIDNADALGYSAAFKMIIEPSSGGANMADFGFYIASVSRPAGSSPGKLVVDWSFDQDQAEVFTPGEDFPEFPDSGLLATEESPLEAGSSIIVSNVYWRGEGDFSYKRFFSRAGPGGIHRVDRYAIRWPRRSTKVEFVHGISD